MMQQNRRSPRRPPRRTLIVEALEDRTLLNGVVTAARNSAGVLQIVGDTADNQFTVALSPIAGDIRISGNTGTSTAINSKAFVDFPLAQVSAISMTLRGGKDNVTISGFSIPGSMTIVYGNMADSFTISNFSATSFSLVFSSSGQVGGAVGSGSQAPSSGGVSGSGMGMGIGIGSGIGAPGSGNNGGLLPPG